jgi:hypothetical protein
MTAIELRTLVDSKTQFFASLDIFRRYEPHIGLVSHALSEKKIGGTVYWTSLARAL